MRVHWDHLALPITVVIKERIDEGLSHSTNIGDRKRYKSIKSGVSIPERRKLYSYCVDIGKYIENLAPSSGLFL